jgi:hypothetical protein
MSARCPFKIGDRVRLLSIESLEEDEGLQVGDVGTITEIEPCDAEDGGGYWLHARWPGVAPIFYTLVGDERTYVQDYEDSLIGGIAVHSDDVELHEAPMRYTPAEACEKVRALFDDPTQWARVEDALDAIAEAR